MPSAPLRKRRGPDYALLILIAALTLFGMIMMWSASAVLADQSGHRDPFFYLKRQAAFCTVGLLAAALLLRGDYNRLRAWVWPSLAGILILLAATLMTRPVGGARRWIGWGLKVQPAEFAKFVVLLYLCDYIDRKKSRIKSFLHGFAVPWAVVGLVLGLIALEPDLGTPALIFVTSLLILFIGGSPLLFAGSSLACAAPLAVYEVFHYRYRLERMTTFLDPAAHAQDAGYQLWQAILAVGSGGLLGKGLGRSQLKLLHLPAPHTDFIFPILCEELGLLGAALVLGLFAAFLVRGLRVARNAPNLFGSLLACAITLLIALQAFFNIAMSIGLVPTKGIPLPFFSYGGSGLIAALAASGILLNISKSSGNAP
jgi:cell division protein FtsW